MTTDAPTVPATDPSAGLDEHEVAAARDRYGANQLTPIDPASIGELIVDALGDPMLRILIGCAVLSLAVGATHGEWVDGIAIALAVVIVTLVGVYNQRRAQRDYAALDAVARQENVRVIRGGVLALIDSSELVVGDVLEVTSGDVLAADGVLRSGGGLLVSEAHVTGEPETSKDRETGLYAGSRVLDGSGRVVVAAVGDATVFGAARLEVAETDKTTPLEERLDGLAKTIGKVGTAAAAATFVALMISGFATGDAPDLAADRAFLEFVLDALTIAVTIIVVAVPEGLPLAVTLSLAYTTRRMARDQALVRELAACETMGSATVVCSDKTGTLTTGTMSPAGVVIGDDRFGPEDTAELRRQHPAAYGRLVDGIVLNSNADLLVVDGVESIVGNQTEGALLRWLRDDGVDHLDLRSSSRQIGRTEFNSTRKYMATSVAGDAGARLLVKGAPEVVLARCAGRVVGDDVLPLDEGSRDRLLHGIRAEAGRGHRLLALAEMPIGADAEHPEAFEGLAFVGYAVLADPLRPEVPAAVQRCRAAGVRVMMITGDISETAQEIASQAGIASGVDAVLDGDTLRAMDDDALVERLGRTAVLSRTLPSDKRRVVELLQAQGDVVAVTGDGVNDAPALALADVGFSMGSGAQVAREASDIVIVDDNFASLVRAIRWGRSVFENIRKFLQFQLTVNVVALTVAFVAALAGKGTPLTAVQLLWVNLIMDSLGALALALEPPTDELFAQPPHGRSEPLISRSMWINVLGVGAFMITVLLVALFTDLLVDPDGADADLYRATFVFNAFVFMQIANEFNSRSTRFERSPWRGLLASPVFLAIVAIVTMTQLAIMAFGGGVFDVVSLDGADWARCLVLAAAVPVVGAVIRLVGRAVAPSSAKSAVHA